MQKIKSQLVKLFEDKTKIDALLNSDKKELAKNLNDLLQLATQDT